MLILSWGILIDKRNRMQSHRVQIKLDFKTKNLFSNSGFLLTCVDDLALLSYLMSWCTQVSKMVRNTIKMKIYS